MAGDPELNQPVDIGPVLGEYGIISGGGLPDTSSVVIIQGRDPKWIGQMVEDLQAVGHTPVDVLIEGAPDEANLTRLGLKPDAAVASWQGPDGPEWLDDALSEVATDHVLHFSSEMLSRMTPDNFLRIMQIIAFLRVMIGWSAAKNAPTITGVESPEVVIDDDLLDQIRTVMWRHEPQTRAQLSEAIVDAQAAAGEKHSVLVVAASETHFDKEELTDDFLGPLRDHGIHFVILKPYPPKD